MQNLYDDQEIKVGRTESGEIWIEKKKKIPDIDRLVAVKIRPERHSLVIVCKAGNLIVSHEGNDPAVIAYSQPGNPNNFSFD